MLRERFSPDTQAHKYWPENQNKTFRKPTGRLAQKLISDKFNANTERNNVWKHSDLDKLNLIENPTKRVHRALTSPEMIGLY